MFWHRRLIIAADTTTGARNLRYDGEPEKTPVLMDREDTRWRTSIESKQREKYETNQINENIGGKLALRGIAGCSAGADDNNYNEHRPVTGTTTTQQTTTSSAGNIVTYTPDSDYFMFRTTSGASPVRYYYTKDTTVVDPAGRVVNWSAIRPDMPATVYYSTVGDRVVVRKVVLASQPAAVIKQEETTTTTTTRP